MASQVKMLRVLQQHTFEPLGESRPRKVDIRVVCATNADIQTKVRDRSFREDLFYRINLITLTLPALRDRRDDIPALVRHFMSLAAKNARMATPGISAEAMEFLTRLPYPGNIRQLKNMVERAVLIGGDTLTRDLFGHDDNDVSEADVTAAGNLGDMEREAVADALRQAGGNMSHAARILGITRQSLYRRKEKYGL